MPISFALEATCGGARTGWLQSSRQRLPTPIMLPFTKKAVPPSLTLDNLKTTDALPALHVSLPHMVEHVDNISKQGGGLDAFLGGPAKTWFMGTRDSCHTQAGFPAGDTFVTVETSKGRKQMTADAFINAMTAFRVDAVASLCDEVAETAGNKRARKAVDRTLIWLDAILHAQATRAPETSVLGVVQLGAYERERARSCTETAKRAVQGFVIGGLGLGESTEERATRLEQAMITLPAALPRWLQGLGDPDAVLLAVAHGVDIFETSYPFLQSELGCALVFPTSVEAFIDDAGRVEGPFKIDLHDIKYRRDTTPFCAGCKCEACTRHTRAYIHHLINTREILADVYLNIHNLHHYSLFFEAVRESIARDKFAAFAEGFSQWRATCE